MKRLLPLTLVLLSPFGGALLAQEEASSGPSEACLKSPEAALQRCSSDEWMGALNASEDQFPRDYQGALSVLESCAEAVALCYKTCNDGTVGPGDSLLSLVRKLHDKVGKTPVVDPLYDCRQSLKSFSDDVEQSCRDRNLEQKVIIEKSAKNLRPLVQICKGMGKMEAVGKTGGTKTLGNQSPEDIQSTSTTQGVAFGKYTKGREELYGDLPEDLDVEDREHGDPEDDDVADPRASSRQFKDAAALEKGRYFEGGTKGVGRGQQIRAPKQPDINRKERKFVDKNPFASRSQRPVKKIPMHGLSPVQNQALKAKDYGKVKGERQKSPPPLRILKNENVVDLQLPAGDPQLTLWETQDRAFRELRKNTPRK